MVLPHIEGFTKEISTCPYVYLNGSTWNNSIESRWYYLTFKTLTSEI